MRILVTGHEGFIGKNLALHLMNAGHEVEGWEYIPNVIPDPSSYDWVIHLGAISSTTYKDVEQIMEQNFEYSCRMLQVCDTMGVNFQYASSASVYGTNTDFSEDAPKNPQSPYAWTKFLFDRFVEQHLDDLQILCQGFRYFNVYGQYEEHKADQASPVSKFTRQAEEYGKIKLFENSDKYKRDFICVNDICKIHENMLGVDQSGIFNIGTGSTTSFADVAKAISKKYNADIEYIPMPDTLKGQYQEYTKADISKLKEHIDLDFTTVEDYINGRS